MYMVCQSCSVCAPDLPFLPPPSLPLSLPNSMHLLPLLLHITCACFYQKARAARSRSHSQERSRTVVGDAAHGGGATASPGNTRREQRRRREPSPTGKASARSNAGASEDKADAHSRKSRCRVVTALDISEQCCHLSVTMPPACHTGHTITPTCAASRHVRLNSDSIGLQLTVLYAIAPAARTPCTPLALLLGPWGDPAMPCVRSQLPSCPGCNNAVAQPILRPWWAHVGAGQPLCVSGVSPQTRQWSSAV